MQTAYTCAKRGNKIMKVLKWLSIVFLFTLLCSCEDELTKVYVRNINPNANAPYGQSVTLDLEGDTIYIYSNRTVNFTYNDNIHKLKAVIYTLDGKSDTITSNTGSFKIDYDNLYEGNHTLEVQTYTSSGTGSIADKIGVEGYVGTKKWTLIVIKGSQNYYKASVDNGYLRLSWLEYTASELQNYIIYRVISGNLVKIGTSQTNTFVDSTYVGEGATYKVSAISKSNPPFYIGVFYLNSELNGTNLTYHAENNVNSISWRKCRYYNALDSMIVTKNLYSGGDYSIIKATTNPDDTTQVLSNCLFATSYYSTVKYIPKKTNYFYIPGYYDGFTIQRSYIIGKKFSQTKNTIDQIYQINATDFVYKVGTDSLVLCHASTGTNYKRMGCNSNGCSSDIQVSVKGSYITNYEDCRNSTLLIKSSSLKTQIKSSLQQYIGSNYASGIPVSDIGTVLAQSTTGGFYLYDFINNQSLGFYNSTNTTGLKISSNGDYILSSETAGYSDISLIKFANSQFSKLWTSSGIYSPKFYDFDKVNSDQFVYWNEQTFCVIKCSDLSNARTFSLTDATILNIDYYNNEMLTYNSGHLYVRSYLDGSILHDVPTQYNIYQFHKPICLINHTIVCKDGIYLTLN